MTKARRLCWASLLMGLLAGPLAADVGVVFQSEHHDTSWEDVFFLAIGLALSDEGYSSLRGSQGAEYRLVTAYEPNDEGVRATLTLETANQTLATVDDQFTLEGDLEAQIGAAVHRLFEQTGLKRPTAAEASIQGVIVLPPTVDPFNVASGWSVEALVGGAAYLGPWAKVARYGAVSGVQAAWFFPWQGMRVVAALRLSETRDFTNENLLGGPLWTTTIGPEAEIGWALVKGSRLFVQASAGAAVLSVPDPWRHKTLPYTEAGLKAEFLVFGLTWGGELRLRSVFDPEVVLLSLVPALSVGKEF